MTTEAPTATPPSIRVWSVPAELGGRRLDEVVRLLAGTSWSKARRLVASGKVLLEEAVETDGARPVAGGAHLAIDERAPDPRKARRLGPRLVHVDAAFVVVDKPAGLSTVPYEGDPRHERTQTLDALVREELARRFGGHGRRPLGVVQRLDKDTSGLLVFARTVEAKRHLGQQLRVHSMHRRYLAIAHGQVRATTLRSRLAQDRGDGRRGSTSNPRLGKAAVTHVEPLEPLAGATLIACRLETGRTHQIRIHLAEAGHPIVGERVYLRDHLRDAAGTPIEAPRQMLHAAELGFEHPTKGTPLHFEAPPPADFAEVLARLRRPARSSS